MIKNQSSSMESLCQWTDKVFDAYARLGKKIGHWDDGIALAAETARREIKRIIREAA